MKNKNCVIGCIAGVILAFLNVGIFQVEAQQNYSVTFLPGLEGAWGSDLNNLGEVVGWTNNYSSCFLYSNGTVTTWGDGGCVARAINDVSQVVGAVQGDDNHPRSFLYSNGEIAYPGGNGTIWSQAYDINNAGQIVGEYGGNLVIFWQSKIMEIGTNVLGTAYGINDNYGSNGFGQVVGEKDMLINNEPFSEAFIYSNGIIAIYNICCPEGYGYYNGETCSGIAYRVNSIGQVVGGCNREVFVYNTEDKTSIFIGSSIPPADINDAGQVVFTVSNNSSSTFPALYTNGVIYNLFDLIPSNPDLEGLIPIAINSKGQIVANIRNYQGVVLLTPL